ncbi:hypothetical protein Pmani_011263 [Petrolisthes manimaculis]|uniref:Uncharacterized protein n=1 Tax=Petrolisthes manimaculis TaxID=1843537 RepID=A0AAE1Q0E5_9EUCA|nr:hypothetical protein Pmani_011263 [Petrolisthes manimaculis]
MPYKNNHQSSCPLYPDQDDQDDQDAITQIKRVLEQQEEQMVHAVREILKRDEMKRGVTKTGSKQVRVQARNGPVIFNIQNVVNVNMMEGDAPQVSSPNSPTRVTTNPFVCTRRTRRDSRIGSFVTIQSIPKPKEETTSCDETSCVPTPPEPTPETTSCDKTSCVTEPTPEPTPETSCDKTSCVTTSVEPTPIEPTPKTSCDETTCITPPLETSCDITSCDKLETTIETSCNDTTCIPTPESLSTSCDETSCLPTPPEPTPDSRTTSCDETSCLPTVETLKPTLKLTETTCVVKPCQPIHQRIISRTTVKSVIMTPKKKNVTSWSMVYTKQQKHKCVVRVKLTVNLRQK